MTIPYSKATSGSSAINEIRKIIQAFGCSKFAPMEDFVNHTVTIQFEHRGRMVQISASAKGYAAALLRDKPYTNKMRSTKADFEAKALTHGQIAVWSILRDWIKGQITAVETGVLEFEAAFLGQILLPSGETVHEKITAQGLLPKSQTAPSQTHNSG